MIDELWANALDNAELSHLELMSRGDHDPFRRVYGDGGSVFKLVLPARAISTELRLNSWIEEFEILQTLRSVKEVPDGIGVVEVGDVAGLQLKNHAGRELGSERLSPVRAVAVGVRLLVALVRISIAGVSHNDLRASNVLLSGSVVSVVDFDQASRASRRSAFAANLIRQADGRAGRHGSYAGLVREIGRSLFPRRSAVSTRSGGRASMLLKAVIKGRSRRQRRIPSAASMPTERTRALVGAWEMAAVSKASSPGIPVAYYSLECDGVTLPGERSWAERWEYLSGATEFEQARVLELGCNLGLLSTFVSLHAGAEASLGVDHDADIVRAAVTVADAYGAASQFRVADLDNDPNWEAELAAFEPDIVTCLNVDHWLKDPERLYRFLGQFGRLIFEGHGTTEAEYKKLERLGFTSISLLALSERSRPVLFAEKA